MKNQDDLARGWFSKAESDLTSARIMTGGKGPYDTACFHCQQAVEKYMKGFLAWHDFDFPFTHDLEQLARHCLTLRAELKVAAPEVTALTKYAVELRYDRDFWPAQQEARRALEVARGVRSEILAVMPKATYPVETE